MYSQLHANYVLYLTEPTPGNRYRQIAVVEKDKFELRIFEGVVTQIEPKFDVNSLDAEVHFYDDLNAAMAGAKTECQQSEAAGWVLHHRE